MNLQPSVFKVEYLGSGELPNKIKVTFLPSKAAFICLYQIEKYAQMYISCKALPHKVDKTNVNAHKFKNFRLRGTYLPNCYNCYKIQIIQN